MVLVLHITLPRTTMAPRSELIRTLQVLYVCSRPYSCDNPGLSVLQRLAQPINGDTILIHS